MNSIVLPVVAMLVLCCPQALYGGDGYEPPTTIEEELAIGGEGEELSPLAGYLPPANERFTPTVQNGCDTGGCGNVDWSACTSPTLDCSNVDCSGVDCSNLAPCIIVASVCIVGSCIGGIVLVSKLAGSKPKPKVKGEELEEEPQKEGEGPDGEGSGEGEGEDSEWED